MFRLILYFMAGYVIYRLFKNFLTKPLPGQGGSAESKSARTPIDRIQDAEFTEIDSKIKNKQKPI
ncbi:MAG: hypothetical protein HGB19_09125 [Chlorobiales bacterium]|nr:hypothetical protein [Chlorobiales bacterium]